MYSAIFIDDEDMIRENIKYLADFEGNGISLDATFSNLTDATEYMLKNNVDMVLADIVIGSESGLDFAEYCAEKYPDVIVIVISAYKEFKYAKRALDCRVFSYISKPTDYDELNETLKRASEKIALAYERKKRSFQQPQESSKVAKVREFIEDNVFSEKNMTREYVAEYIGMTPTYFSRWFKSNFSTSYVHYINNLKIKKAMKMLEETNLSLNDICLECGYYTLHYFMNKFYEINGMTPNEYRKSRENKK